MKAVVLGATGLIGTSLIRHLADQTACTSVTSLSRRRQIASIDKVDEQVIDFDNLAAHAAHITGDVLFSTLGTTKEQAGSIAAQKIVDVDYQFNVAKIAADNKVPHYVLVSSSGANAASRNPYLKMKGELEDAVKQLPFERISILQPSLLLGPRQPARKGEVIGQFIMPLFTWLPGLRKYRPIHCDMVAKKMWRACEDQTDAIATYRLDEIFGA